jgi:hypothetical protein
MNVNTIRINPQINNNSMSDENQIRKFKCNRCQKSKEVLKKVADQQQHGFACEECWTAIDKRSRYNGCQIG